MTAARIDHLVVAADSLEQGAAWCEATLGVAPAAGGEHPLMGTHNRLLRVATVDHPRAYLEVIAPNPSAPGPGRRRWFDLDDERVRTSLRGDGPRLVHWVAQVPDIDQALAALRRLGIDRGEAITASRMTPRGLLQWRISIRADGQRLFDGCLPTLIEWGEVHPGPSLPESGVALQSLAITHPRASELGRALEAVGVEQASVTEGPPNLGVVLLTPAGPARLESRGL